MPIDLKWEEPDLLTIIYSGVVGGPEALNSLLEIGGDPRFDQLRGIIGDSSRIMHNIASDVDIEKLIAVTAALAKTNPKIKNAVIMGQDESSQALVEFYRFLADSIEWEVEVFQSEPEARQWINQ